MDRKHQIADCDAETDVRDCMRERVEIKGEYLRWLSTGRDTLKRALTCNYFTFTSLAFVTQLQVPQG